MPVDKRRRRRGLRGHAQPVGRARGRGDEGRDETTPRDRSGGWSPTLRREKAPIERLLDRYAKLYTPAAILLGARPLAAVGRSAPSDHRAHRLLPVRHGARDADRARGVGRERRASRQPRQEGRDGRGAGGRDDGRVRQDRHAHRREPAAGSASVPLDGAWRSRAPAPRRLGREAQRAPARAHRRSGGDGRGMAVDDPHVVHATARPRRAGERRRPGGHRRASRPARRAGVPRWPPRSRGRSESSRRAVGRVVARAGRSEYRESGIRGGRAARFGSGGLLVLEDALRAEARQTISDCGDEASIRCSSPETTG